MGSFNHKCNFSQLPAVYGDRIVVLVGVRITKNNMDSDGFAPGNSFTPISVPIRGTYNDYGAIEDVDRTPGVETLEAYFGMDVEKIVDCAERITCGCGDQVKNELAKINKVIKQNYGYEYSKECGLKFSYIMEHEKIFDKLLAMPNVKMKDQYHWRIPHDFLEELGYKPKTVGKNDGYDVIVWTHGTLPTLKESCYTWKVSDFGDYEKVYNTIDEFCKYIGCEVPVKYNKRYYDNCFSEDVKFVNDKKNWMGSLLLMPQNDEYSFIKSFSRYGLFSGGEYYGLPSFLLSSLNAQQQEHLKHKYKKEVVEIALLYKSMEILQMTWNNTSYYRQDVDYDDHIEFLKSCLSVAKAKKKEHNYVEEDE